MILKPGRDTTHGGHTCLQYAPAEWILRPSDRSGQTELKGKHRKVNNQVIIAGSTTGFIRMWRYPATPDQCAWEVRADATNSSVPVVDIAFLTTPGHLATLNQRGVVTLFDTFNLESTTFSIGKGTPKVLKRLCTLHSSAGSTLPSVRNMLLQSGIESTGSFSLLLQLDNGISGRYCCRKESWVDEGGRALDRAEISVLCRSTRKRALIIGNGVEATDMSDSCLVPLCRPVYPSYLAHVVQASGNRVTIAELDNRRSAPSSSGCEGKENRPTNTSVHKCHLYDKPTYIKTEHIGCTLPGHLISATLGEREVVTSHYLEQYLSSSVLSQSSLERSDRIVFDWSLSTQTYSSSSSSSSSGPERAPFVDSNGRACGDDSLEGKVDQIFGNTLLLKEPYCGPNVSGGYPRIRLRSNLVSHTTPQVAAASVGGKERTIMMPSAVAALASHPVLPYVLAAGQGDALYVISTEFTRETCDEEGCSGAV